MSNSITELQERYLSILPRIEGIAFVAFRAFPRDDREDAVGGQILRRMTPENRAVAFVKRSVAHVMQTVLRDRSPDLPVTSRRFAIRVKRKRSVEAHHCLRSLPSSSCRVTMGTKPISRPCGGVTITAGSRSASWPIVGGGR